jgi:hypothetical protein
MLVPALIFLAKAAGGKIIMNVSKKDSIITAG